MRSALQDEGTGGDGSRIACDVLPKARETSFRRAHRMAARFRTLPPAPSSSRRCAPMCRPHRSRIRGDRRRAEMSALERVADRRSRARSTTMLRRTMRSQRDAGESLCPNSRSARGGSSRAERGTARSASPHRVLISAAPQARRSDRPREQARAWPSGRRRTLCSCKALRPPRRRVCARQAASRTSPAKTRGPLTSSSRRPARDKCAMSRKGLRERRRRRGLKGPRPVSSLSVASLEALGLWCRRVAPEPRCPPRGGRASCSRIDRASSSGRAWRAAIRSSRVGSPAPLRTGR